MEEGFLDSEGGEMVSWGLGAKRREGETYLAMWPSFNRMAFICDRKSGSWVVGA